MGKTKTLKRKRLALDVVKNDRVVAAPIISNVHEPQSVQTIIPDEDLEITIETIQALTNYPNLIKSKACKDLRVAVYDFRQACTIGVNTAGRFATLVVNGF